MNQSHCGVTAEQDAALIQALHEAKQPGMGYRIAKRTLDICASFCALVVLSPILLLIALVILIDDPKGSPFFCQERVGLGGKTFRFYKFRSMVSNAEDLLEELLDENEMEGPAFKIKDDPRITRVGRFLRKTSLDELPQLLNVLRGDMSLVGPRPPLPREVAEYTELQKLRLTVTPGLTCYWQIAPQRNDISFDEWVRLDIQYIINRSFLLDLKLIFKTVGVMFSGEGR